MHQLTVNANARFSRSRSLIPISSWLLERELAEDGIEGSDENVKMTSRAGLKFQAETGAGWQQKLPFRAP